MSAAIKTHVCEAKSMEITSFGEALSHMKDLHNVSFAVCTA